MKKYERMGHLLRWVISDWWFTHHVTDRPIKPEDLEQQTTVENLREQDLPSNLVPDLREWRRSSRSTRLKMCAAHLASETKTPINPDMRSEYDFKGGERGKYAHRVTIGGGRSGVRAVVWTETNASSAHKALDWLLGRIPLGEVPGVPTREQADAWAESVLKDVLDRFRGETKETT